MAGAAPRQRGGESLCRNLGPQLVGGSVVGSTRRTYESGDRPWRTFRRLGYQECLELRDSESIARPGFLLSLPRRVARQKVIGLTLFVGNSLLPSVSMG